MVESASVESAKAKVTAFLGRRVVAFYPALAQVCGGAKAALMLAQLLSMTGSNYGVPVLVAALQEMLSQDTLPLRDFMPIRDTIPQVQSELWELRRRLLSY